MNKKLITSVCALAMALLLALSACGGSSSGTSTSGGNDAGSAGSNDAGSSSSNDAAAESAAQDDGTVTFTMYMGDNNNTVTTQPKDMPVWVEVLKLCGVNLEVEYIVGQDEAQKAGLMIAANDYPDIIMPHDARDQFLAAEALMPINDLIEEHGKNILALYGDYINRMYKPEYGGNIYSWTGFGMSRDLETPGSGFYIAADALAANGWPVITDVDTYFDMIIEYAENNPTMNGNKTIAFSGPAEGWRFAFFMLGADKLMGMHNTGGMYYDPDDNWAPTPRETMPHRKDYLRRMFELNQKGILDPEVFSQTYDQYVAKVASGSIVGMFDEYWEISEAVTNLKNNPDMMGAYPVPMPIKYPGVAQDSYMGVSVVGSSEGACITTSCHDPVRAMQFMDRLAHDDIQILLNWGIEGEHYIVSNGRLDLTDDQWLARQQPDFTARTGVGALTWHFPKPMEDWADYRNGMGPIGVKYAEKSIERLFSPEQLTILDNLGWKTFTDPFGPNFISPFGYGWDISRPPDDDLLNDISAAVGEINVDSYYQKMVLAKDLAEFDSLWDELVGRISQIDRAPEIKFFHETVLQRIKDWN